MRADPARADATKPRVPVQMNEAANPFQEKWIGVDGPIDTSTASAASKPVPIPGSGNGGSGGRGLAIDHVDTFLGAFSSAPTDSPVGSPTRPPPLSAQDLEEGAARAGVSLSDAAASSGLPSPIGTSSLRKVQKMFFFLKKIFHFSFFYSFFGKLKKTHYTDWWAKLLHSLPPSCDGGVECNPYL